MAIETKRKLAAIMFTDIVGYTALMQRDEKQAIDIRHRHKNILQREISKHEGKIIQFYGDGTLSIFDSAVNAVECAIGIQQELQNEPKIPLRIGLHSGDIVFEEGGAYGDGVNIASRIESASVPGGILFSEKIYDEIKNHPNFQVKPLGQQHFKNVSKPLSIFAIANEGIIVPEEIKSTSSKFNSVAVLPFVNNSADPENEYFSDGITEEVINALSTIEDIYITSRTSSFAFKGQNKDIREIARQLNVETVLEGSVRKAGNRIRISTQLINASNGYHILSETYDRDLQDIFEVQDEISKKIVDKLKSSISAKDNRRKDEPFVENTVLVKAYTDNIEAYNLFLKGRYFWNKWSPSSTITAVKYFNESIEKAPDFALPYSGLAICYSFLGGIWKKINSRIAYQKAKAAAYKAIELDETLGESHMALGIVRLFFDYDIEGANLSFKKALKLNPGKADIHHGYYMYLNAVEDYEESLKEITFAHKLDPFSVPINTSLGHVLMLCGKYDEAIEQYRKAIDLDENSKISLKGLGWTYLVKGELDEAIKIFTKVAELDGYNKKHSALGFAYAKAGKTDKALDHLLKLKSIEESNKEIALALDYAVIYAGLGDIDHAFEYLFKAYNEREGGVIFIKSNPAFTELKKDNRFDQLVQLIGLEEKNYKLDESR